MIATALAVAFVVISCKEKLDVAQALDLDNTPMQIVDDMFIVHTENGILQIRVEAPLMERYKKDTVEYELFPKGLAVYAYTDEGLLETQILSDNAKHQKFSDGRETWAAFGNVVVKNLIEQQTMETDTLYWNQQDEKLYTDCYVKMYSPDGFMQGYGMESDQKASTAYILRPFNNYAVIIQDSTQVVIDSANFIGPLQKN